MSDAPTLSQFDLSGTAWAGWRQTALAGDASARRYVRLTGPLDETVIVMKTAADTAGETDAFLAIARHLRGIGLCPPEILFATPAQDMLVIEDLGPFHFAQWLETAPADAQVLYRAATDVLAVVQAHPAPSGLVALTPDHASGMIAPLFAHYVPAVSPQLAQDLREALRQALAAHAPEATTLALRDYHAENLIWRPARHGTDRIGLLDFQDAVLAPPAYDLVSLLRDARRDVPAPLVEDILAHYCTETGQRATRAAFCVLGVQRNLRILGIFARLATRAGKPRYLDLMPRVWGHIMSDLRHPALAAMRPLVARLPAPDADHLRRLRAA